MRQRPTHMRQPANLFLVGGDSTTPIRGFPPSPYPVCGEGSSSRVWSPAFPLPQAEKAPLPGALAAASSLGLVRVHRASEEVTSGSLIIGPVRDRLACRESTPGAPTRC